MVHELKHRKAATVAMVSVVLFAGSALGYAAPVEQPIKAPECAKQKNTHFCCGKVNAKTKKGEDCYHIGELAINDCGRVLSCSGGWTLDDGEVECSDD